MFVCVPEALQTGRLCLPAAIEPSYLEAFSTFWIFYTVAVLLLPNSVRLASSSSSNESSRLNTGQENSSRWQTSPELWYLLPEVRWEPEQRHWLCEDTLPLELFGTAARN
jgi:hypothetical protein